VRQVGQLPRIIARCTVNKTLKIHNSINLGYNDNASHCFQYSFPRSRLSWAFYHPLLLERASPL